MPAVSIYIADQNKIVQKVIDQNICLTASLDQKHTFG
jgi:hypothetical protein